MNREEARREIRSRWRQIIVEYTDVARDKVEGKETYICPFCGHGTNGDGLKNNPKSPDGNGIKCFGCNFAGDIIDFIRQLNHTDYNTALKEAADVIGITIDPNRPAAADDFKEDDTEAQHDRAQAAQSAGNATADKKPAGTANGAGSAPQTPTEDGITDYSAYYKECCARIDDPAAISYLQARGISRETAAAYNLGFDPAWISPKAIKTCRETGKQLPPASARIITPVSSNHYLARAISPDVQKQFQKMNETGGGHVEIFNPAALYSGAEAVFITEGLFDALSIIEAGAAAVALNSTSNTTKLLELLGKRPTKATLVLSLDNDDGGKKATETLRDGLSRLNVSYITANIAGRFKDANDALRDDRAAFEAAIQTAQAQTAARPDNTAFYISELMAGEIERFKDEKKTGFSNLDAQAGGLYSGLYALAAISSLGKTSFALQMCDQLAAAGHDVLYFSLEQSRLELVSKSIARYTVKTDGKGRLDFGKAVTSLSIRKGYLPKHVLEAAEEYKQAVGDRISVIEGNFSCDISFIGDYIRRYIRQNETRPVVFVDYLQILQPADDERRRTTKEVIDTTVTELKRISREMNLTVFIISSVNRANYLTPIDFESLKESGSIEYSCDVVWGLQLQCLNEDVFSKEGKIREKRARVKRAKAENPRKIQLVCLKNRYGIANFSCGFNYYPANDLFTADDGDNIDPWSMDADEWRGGQSMTTRLKRG